MDEKPKPYSDRIHSIEHAISQLEGWSFGKHFQFTTIYYQLHHSINGGWNEVKGFRELPGLDEFANKLNAAIEPIAKEYANRLRQDMANECTKVAARSLNGVS